MGAQKLVTVVRSGLGWELRCIREQQRQLTLDPVCEQLRWPLSKLSRMETGKQCISEVDLGALLAIYQVHGQERQRLLRLVQRQDDPGRWETSLPDEPGSKTFFRLEPEASALVTAELVLVPGLAQTADYARAGMEAAHMSPDQIEARVPERIERKKILTRQKPPKLDMIVEETALRRVVGSHKVMAAQLRALLELAELPNVRLWVVPVARSARAGFTEPFYLMEFNSGTGPVVYLEGAISVVFLEELDKVELYRRHASRLAKAALNPVESANFVAAIRREHERE
jgi:hypothetical protein